MSGWRECVRLVSVAGVTGIAIWSCAPQPHTEDAPPPPRQVGGGESAASPESRRDPAWWLESPEIRAGRFRAAADATGPNLGEARREAVERGLAILDQHFPEGRPKYELTTWAGAAPEGGYRVAVLVEADLSGTRAGAQRAKDGP